LFLKKILNSTTACADVSTRWFNLSTAKAWKFGKTRVTRRRTLLVSMDIEKWDFENLIYKKTPIFLYWVGVSILQVFFYTQTKQLDLRDPAVPHRIRVHRCIRRFTNQDESYCPHFPSGSKIRQTTQFYFPAFSTCHMLSSCFHPGMGFTAVFWSSNFLFG